MDTIRVHPKGFKFLFCLYHGSAAVGLALITSFLLQIIAYDICFLIGTLMVSLPFFLAPPEIIFLIKDQKMIFRHRISCTTIAFSNISQIKTSARLIEIVNTETQTLLKINKEHFKNIDIRELSEYIKELLFANQEIDPMKYTSVKITECKFIDRCKSAFFKTVMKLKTFGM